MAENPLTKLPLAGQLGVALGAFVAIVAAFYFGYYTEAAQKEQDLTGQLETLSAEVTALKATAARLPEFQKKVAELEQQLTGLKTILPPAKETPDLMRRVQYLASQSNLNIKSFRPGKAVPKDFYEEWPIAVSVEGTYHNLATFFDRVARLRRLVNIGDVKVKAVSKQSVNSTVAASCSATTFVYLDKPLAAPDKKKAPQKGKK